MRITAIADFRLAKLPDYKTFFDFSEDVYTEITVYYRCTGRGEIYSSVFVML